MCNAKITINKGVYPCACDAGHAGLHICQGIKLSHIVYDGFDWGIDASGQTVLQMPRAVAAVVFDIPGTYRDPVLDTPTPPVEENQKAQPKDEPIPPEVGPLDETGKK